ncbi:unnamed protein product, partial [marine sediment metagenome]
MVEVQEEQKYKRLRKLAQELHLPIPEAFIELEVFDKDGRLLQRHKQRSHSWTRNAYNLLLSQMGAKNMDDAAFGAGLLSIKDTVAAPRDGDKGVTISSADNFEDFGAGYRAAAASIINGVQVG